jgi:hypothetical protein
MSTSRSETIFVNFVIPVEVPREFSTEQKIKCAADLAVQELNRDKMPMIHVYGENSERFDITMRREYHFTPTTLKAIAYIVKENRVDIIGTGNKENT